MKSVPDFGLMLRLGFVCLLFSFTLDLGMNEKKWHANDTWLWDFRPFRVSSQRHGGHF